MPSFHALIKNDPRALLGERMSSSNRDTGNGGASQSLALSGEGRCCLGTAA